MKKYFITGLLIWIPLAITAWVLSLIVRSMDQSLLLLPQAIHPEHLLGMYIPGIGALLTLLVVFLTGLITTNIVGQRLVRFWEGVLARIPVVKSIYYSVKQVSDTLFSGTGVAFRKVLLVRYPHPEAWSVAFQTGNPARDVADMLPEEHVGVFIPTTPSPVNGFFFFVKRKDVIELDMNVDEALKYIVSMGVVAPPMRNPLGRAQNQ
ncbi:MAG: transmembrane protein [Rhodocyclaceae bacterium]|nr:MAG: transmembrane protein [Rhodocyclaceae bacterium]TND04747.1 MAG: transmembrane protein [Rhodocyclaceae bacterium]